MKHQLCYALLALSLTSFTGCVDTGVKSSTITGNVTTGAGTLSVSPQLRLALGDSAIAAATNAVNAFYKATPTGAATEAVKKGVDAAADAYKADKGQVLPEAAKAELGKSLSDSLEKKRNKN